MSTIQQLSVEQARRYYAGADAVHDFDHVLRVLALAERIGQAEGADMEIVRAAALLHDLGRHEADAAGADHAALAAERAQQILAAWPVERCRAVTEAIAAHRFRSAPAPASREAQVLFDADKLDAIGAVGVARAFAYGGLHGQRLWAAVDGAYVETWEAHGDQWDHHTPVHEFVVKLSRLKERLYTAAGRRIAEERHAFMAAFFERMAQEVAGEA